MEKHFKTRDFEVLIGAARVLGESFEMNIAEVEKTGGIDLAREQIVSKLRDVCSTTRKKPNEKSE
jgi:hypothetical protein